MRRTEVLKVTTAELENGLAKNPFSKPTLADAGIEFIRSRGRF
jgi:hypothetical protein